MNNMTPAMIEKISVAIIEFAKPVNSIRVNDETYRLILGHAPRVPVTTTQDGVLGHKLHLVSPDELAVGCFYLTGTDGSVSKTYVLPLPGKEKEPTYEPVTVAVRTYEELPVSLRMQVVLQVSTLLRRAAECHSDWTTDDSRFVLHAALDEVVNE